MNDYVQCRACGSEPEKFVQRSPSGDVHMVRCSKYHTCPSWAVVGGQNPDQAREHWNQLHRQQDQEADGPIIDHLQPGDKVQLRINAGDRWRDGLIKENEQLGLVATYRRSAGYFLLDDLQEHQIRLVEN